MSPFSQANYAYADTGDVVLRDESSILKQQLVREITCLERQLERVRARDALIDNATLNTYEEMIESRRKMLHNLPWE